MEYITANELRRAVKANPKKFYMGATKYTEKNLKMVLDSPKGCIVQHKIDGVYFRIHRIGGAVVGFLRSGREIDIRLLRIYIPELLPHDCFVEGELVAEVDGVSCRREQTSGYITTITKGDLDDLPSGLIFKYHIWFVGNIGDSIIDGYKKATAVASSTFYNWLYIPTLSPTEDLLQKAKDVIESHKQDSTMSPRDGLVVKDPYMPWTPGKPKWCVKVKPTHTMVMEVVGTTKHTKRADMFGALECKAITEDGAIWVNVGSGLTDEDRLSDPWQCLGKYVIVEYEDITDYKNGIARLTLPRYKGVYKPNEWR